MSAGETMVVVVTGASSGVGRVAARAFGKAGARVALIARGREGLAATGKEVRDAGGEALELMLDLSQAVAVESAADLIVQTWGSIDVWINNAMVSVFAPVSEMTASEYRRVTEVNYLGTVHGTLAALKHMRRVGAGTIIQIGSALAYRSIPLQSAYCASKAAIRGFTDSLRSELIHERSAIKITMLQLPAVNTPHFEVARNKLGKHARPVPPLYQPEAVESAILDAAAHPQRETWVGWKTTTAIVGQKLVPGMLDRYLAHVAWDAQVTNELPPTTKDNLLSPLPGDHGAHGPFDGEARSSTASGWARGHRKGVALLAVAAGVTVGVAAARRFLG